MWLLKGTGSHEQIQVATKLMAKNLSDEQAKAVAMILQHPRQGYFIAALNQDCAENIGHIFSPKFSITSPMQADIGVVGITEYDAECLIRWMSLKSTLTPLTKHMKAEDIDKLPQVFEIDSLIAGTGVTTLKGEGSSK